MNTVFSFLRSVLLVALMATAMVMLANQAHAVTISPTEFYNENADTLEVETKRLIDQSRKALQLHQMLLANKISTRSAFTDSLYQLIRAESRIAEILNPARFRMGIPSKRGIETKQYPAMLLTLEQTQPTRTRSGEIRDLIKMESRRYNEVLAASEKELIEVEEELTKLSDLRNQIRNTRYEKDAKRNYEYYLRQLSTLKQRYYQAMNEFCVAAAQAEHQGLNGRRLAPGNSPFQLRSADS